jgi:hypothetical protein
MLAGVWQLQCAKLLGLVKFIIVKLEQFDE